MCKPNVSHLIYFSFLTCAFYELLLFVWRAHIQTRIYMYISNADIHAFISLSSMNISLPLCLGVHGLNNENHIHTHLSNSFFFVPFLLSENAFQMEIQNQKSIPRENGTTTTLKKTFLYALLRTFSVLISLPCIFDSLIRRNMKY